MGNLRPLHGKRKKLPEYLSNSLLFFGEILICLILAQISRLPRFCQKRDSSSGKKFRGLKIEIRGS